jgi:hypothetical protein
MFGSPQSCASGRGWLNAQSTAAFRPSASEAVVPRPDTVVPGCAADGCSWRGVAEELASRRWHFADVRKPTATKELCRWICGRSYGTPALSPFFAKSERWGNARLRPHTHRHNNIQILCIFVLKCRRLTVIDYPCSTVRTASKDA